MASQNMNSEPFASYSLGVRDWEKEVVQWSRRLQMDWKRAFGITQSQYNQIFNQWYL